MANWNRSSRFNPNLIISRIGEYWDDDRGHNRIFAETQLRSALMSMVEIDERIPSADKATIVAKAIHQAGEDSTFTENDLIKYISILENEYLTCPPQLYVMASSLSISTPFEPIATRRIAGSTLTFSKHSLPIEFKKARCQLQDRVDSFSLPLSPRSSHTAVRISVRALSISHAADVALRRLDLLRGIWNLRLNWTFSDSWRLTAGRPTPINSIIGGPIHSLHFPDGRLATTAFWYEPDYSPPTSPLSDKRKLKAAYEYERTCRKRLRNSPFRTMLETSIVRYARALDRTDWSLCLLSLWQLLERLTNTGPQDTYEVTIRRATFKFEDRDFHVEVLRHLKEYRNQFVHHGEISSEAEHMAFQLKYYVDELLNYLIFNPHHLASMPEAAAFMDMAAGSDSLSQKLISTQEKLALVQQERLLLDKAIAFWEASSAPS